MSFKCSVIYSKYDIRQLSNCCLIMTACNIIYLRNSETQSVLSGRVLKHFGTSEIPYISNPNIMINRTNNDEMIFVL